jgi:integrase
MTQNFFANCSRLINHRFLKPNPTNLCDLPKGQKKEIVPLEQEDVTRLLKAIQGEKYEIIYLVTLFTGLRQGEVLGLTWDCVDFDRNMLYINKQLTKTGKVGGAYCLSETKTSQSRTITVAPTVMKYLEKQKARQNEQKLIAGEGWSNDWNLVFTNELGGHLAHFTVYKNFKKIVKSLGLENVRFHDLRHSFAVACLESGDDIKTVQENLGHSSPAFTMSVYAHASQKMRQRSADNMERYIKSVSQK